MKPIQYLKRFAPETHSIQVPYEAAKPLMDSGLIRWVGYYLGTHQYALTVDGKKLREQDKWQK